MKTPNLLTLLRLGYRDGLLWRIHVGSTGFYSPLFHVKHLFNTLTIILRPSLGDNITLHTSNKNLAAKLIKPSSKDSTKINIQFSR